MKVKKEIAKVTQPFGTIVTMPIGLNKKVCKDSVNALNSVLADTIILRDMYKKHHWQVSGPQFYSLHLLFDKHYQEQADLVDELAERIQSLGGISVAMGPEVGAFSSITCPPKGREQPEQQIKRLLDGHEILLQGARKGAKMAQESGDDGTNDLLISDIVRTNEKQVWFLIQHIK